MFDYVYAQAEEAIRRYQTRDPFVLLDALGAVLIRSDAYRQNGLRGYCTVLNRIPYVVINAKQPPEEQRVVACHEAAHLILHGDKLRIGALKDLDVYNVTSKLEREANLFAADFLIDDQEVVELMQARDADFFQVAQELCVPSPFFAFKLYSLVARGYQMRMPMELDSQFLK